MSVLGVFRIVCLVLASIFGVIVAAIAADNIAITETEFASEGFTTYFPFAALALAAGGLTLLTLPALLIVDAVRAGAWTSMIAVEMVVSTILWALWLGTAAYVSQQITGIASVNCADFTGDGAILCNGTKAIQAFSFLAWVVIMIYSFILLVFTLIASSRGHNVWLQSVKDTNFFAPSVDAEKVPTEQMAAQYPPNFAPQQPMMYGMPNMQPPMQGMPFQNPQFQGVPFQNPQFQGVPFQGSPMQPSPQPLPAQGPLQNFNPQGYSPQQFQNPLPQYQNAPTDHTPPRMATPQMSDLQMPGPQMTPPQMTTPQV